MSFQTARPWLSRLVAAVLFVGALFVLRAELDAFSFSGLLDGLAELGPGRIGRAAALTAAAFVALVAADWSSAEEARAGLSHLRVLLGAFLGYAFSLTLGSPLFGKAPVRGRLYAAWGMEPETVGRVVGGARLTLATGFLALLGWGLLDLPGLPAPMADRLPSGGLAESVLRLGGAACLALAVGLVVYTAGSRASNLVGIAAARLTSGVLFWSASAGVLYVLLPDAAGIPFGTLLGAFLVAYMAGLLSGVPAGLGVFEAALLALLPGAGQVTGLLVAVLAFRVLYHLVPLLLAAGGVDVQERRPHRETVGVALSALGSGVSSAVPPILSGAVFVAGATLLLTGALPLAPEAFAPDGLPLPVLEASHFLGSLAGTVLLILAWGLSRRLHVAFQTTRILLVVGAVLVGLRGGWLALAPLLALVLVVVAPARREFFRATALTREPLSPDWLLGVVMVLAATTWLGLFAYRDIPLSGELWWDFTLRGDASRFLRASVGAATVLLVFAVLRLLDTPEPDEPEVEDRITPEVEAIAESSPRPDARLVYLGDKHVLLSKGKRAFVMYGVERRSWISMGDPVGEPADFADLVWMFRSRAYRHGGWPVFYQATPACLPLYVDAGLSLLKLGEAAVVDVQGFGLEGGKRAGMRKTVRKVEKGGASFEIIPAKDVPGILPRLREISDAWLAAKDAREKSFSMGAFSEAYVSRFPHAVVRHRERIVAFGNLWLGGDGRDFSGSSTFHVGSSNSSFPANR